jgi:pimeloyl-ACP methyl ester carboxylesterase
MNTLKRRCLSSALVATAWAALAACSSLEKATPEARHADVNGARLAYVEEGQGPTVVLVHGSVADLRSWDRQRALLARHFRVVAYSQRYFGTESWDPAWPKIGAQQQSDDLAAFIRSLGAAPVHLVGWSSGGTVAINVSLQHPELVKAAYVYEPPMMSVITEPSERQMISDDRAEAFGPVVQDLRAGDNSRALRDVLDAAQGRRGALDSWPPSVQAVALDNARTLPLEFFDSDPAPSITCEQLGRMTPYVVVARGSQTRVSYRLMADATAACLGGRQHVVVVAGGRHLWPADEPKAFAEEVRRFMEQSPMAKPTWVNSRRFP